jgi:glycosyltransferase involved in cell wall biosynthesis
VNPNLGEGFGLIPREFAATGGIALATNWSGTADDIQAWGWPIPYTLKPADWRGIDKFRDVELGNWAEPDVEALAEMMRDVVENRERYQAIALRQAPDVHELYSWRQFATVVYEIWREVAYARYAIPAG